MCKPVRTYFCIGAGRSKLKFESEKKADNFIYYNAEEIELENGKAPIRSYYCPFCCAWHVTSNPNAESCEYHARMKFHFVLSKLVKIKAKKVLPFGLRS